MVPVGDFRIKPSSKVRTHRQRCIYRKIVAANPPEFVKLDTFQRSWIIETLQNSFSTPNNDTTAKKRD